MENSLLKGLAHRPTCPGTQHKSNSLKGAWTICGDQFINLKAFAGETEICLEALQGWRHQWVSFLSFPALLLLVLAGDFFTPYLQSASSSRTDTPSHALQVQPTPLQLGWPSAPPTCATVVAHQAMASKHMQPIQKTPLDNLALLARGNAFLGPTSPNQLER